MKTYRETEFYRMMINLNYSLLHFVVLLKIFSDWEMVIEIYLQNRQLASLLIFIPLGGPSSISEKSTD